MTILESIKADQLELRKAGNKELTASLTYILGRASQIKNATDADLIAIIQNIVKNTKKELKDHPDQLNTYEEEFKFITSYLPTELSEEDVKDFLETALHNGEKITKAYIGKVLAFAKKSGKVVDGATVTELVGEYL